MDLSFARDIEQAPDLIHRVRHLGYFRKQFGASVAVIASRSGRVAVPDRVRLTRLFLDWHEDFLAQRAAAEVDRRDYIVFSAGSMLHHLVRNDPLSVALSPADSGTGSAIASLSPEAARIAAFWPEGFIATVYCVSMLETVLAQEGLAPIRLNGSIADLRTWWSFRENAAENPLSAIGFFDRFVGAEPYWEMPGAAHARPAISGRSDTERALH